MQANDIRMAAIPIAEIPPHFFWSSSMAMMICKVKNKWIIGLVLKMLYEASLYFDKILSHLLVLSFIKKGFKMV